jgi:hypothetical protein
VFRLGNLNQVVKATKRGYGSVTVAPSSLVTYSCMPVGDLSDAVYTEPDPQAGTRYCLPEGTLPCGLRDTTSIETSCAESRALRQRAWRQQSSFLRSQRTWGLSMVRRRKVHSTKGRGSLAAAGLMVFGFMATMAPPENPCEYPSARELFARIQTELEAEPLQVLLEEWDQLVASRDFRERDKALWLVATHVKARLFFGAGTAIKYSNEEIKARVVELYLDECARMDASPMEGDKESDPSYGGEAGWEYLSDLMTVAESTFDPRLYEYEVRIMPAATGRLRESYLAVVNPDKTLHIILDAHLGYRDGKKMNQDSLYFTKEGMSASFLLDGAFRVMALMKKESPESLRKQKERVVEFVRVHALHFSAPRKEVYRDEPVRLCWHDFYCRGGAFDVLELLGDSRDLPFAEKLSQDLPDMPEKDFEESPRHYLKRESLTEKARRVIPLLRSREPSEVQQ